MTIRDVSFAVIISLAACCGISRGQSAAPNIIHIFADDLGYGSVGFNGQPRILTPNLDAIASAGLRFTAAYASTLCSPSRAMLMTGFHNGHTSNDRNSNIRAGIRDEDVSVAEVLGAAGYSTAVFGKWGWGGSDPGGGSLRSNPVIETPATLPNNQGYDEFYGYLSHGRAHSYLVDSLWQTDLSATNGLSLSPTGNTSSNPTAAYTHDLINARSLGYIGQHAGDANPFYMQVNYTIPHFDIDAIANFGPGPYDGEPWTQKQKNYAAMITRMDASIGDILAKIRDPNGDRNLTDSIEDDTLIIFTSDNGATNEDGSPISFFDAGGIYRGGKRDLYEGGIRMPTAAMWPGTIPAGTETDLLTDLADFLPTVAELANAQGPVGMDGVSIAPLLTGEGILRDRKYLIFEHHERHGPDPDARDARWTIVRGSDKLIKFSNGNFELFDLANDPGETSPLNLSNPLNAALKNDLQAIALAEGVEREDAYAVEYANWIGSDGDAATDPANWSLNAVPAGNWSAVIRNTATRAAVAQVHIGLSTLGLEVRGDTALQSLRVAQGQTAGGRNEVRIGRHGRVHLDGAFLSSHRWVDVHQGGFLTGQGQVSGDLYNFGTVSPGLPSDLMPPDQPPGDVDTGVISALVFDFTGIQDDAPLTQTSTQSEYMQLVHGFDFGPGTTPRNAVNAGNEFNVSNWTVGGSLATAISNGDYLTFTVAPINGIEMTIDTVDFHVWRNGVNAPRDYAIFTNLDGFLVGDEIATHAVTDDGISNQHLLSGTYTGGQAVQEPVEFRIYGWNAGNNGGNTHFNGVSLTAAFTSVPFVPIRPTGTLALAGDYTQLATGVLEIELGGVSHGVDYDVLDVDGTVSLDGTLRVTLADLGDGLFQPQFGDAFLILTSSSNISGNFASAALQPPGDGLGWQIDYDNNVVTLTVVRLPDGDFNSDGAFDCADVDALVQEIAVGSASLAFDMTGDGRVDAQDLSAWLVAAGAANLPSGNPYLMADANLDGVVEASDFNVWNTNKFTEAAAWCQGDFTADGVIDASDFNIWNAHKFTSSNAATTVPEPCLAGWLAAVLYAACWRKAVL